MHMTLSSWKAKRAGGRITVSGVDEHGQTAKIPNIDTIEPASGFAVATDKNGTTHRLLTN
jgi:hypothetical protein